MRRTKPRERARDRILSDDEICAIWKATGIEGPFSAFVRFLLLTAARRNEARAIRWSEISGQHIWLLPQERNKTKKDLARPLSAAAQAVLASLPRLSDLIFTVDGARAITGIHRYKTRVLDKVSGVTNWTLHDLRRTARSLMSRAGVNADIAERCLGHVIPGVRGVYDHHDYDREMKLAFEALARQIELIVLPRENVVALVQR
jgi:integrase